MATKLKNMRLTSVDMVRAGANQAADICLYKSADPDEAPDKPTAAERNIFKRFIQWLREDAEDDLYEDTEPVGKSDEEDSHDDDPHDLASIYKSAITESLQSIAADGTLSPDEKNDMIEKSIGQYHDAMVELMKSDTSEDMSYLFEGLEKSDEGFTDGDGELYAETETMELFVGESPFDEIMEVE